MMNEMEDLALFVLFRVHGRWTYFFFTLVIEDRIPKSTQHPVLTPLRSNSVIVVKSEDVGAEMPRNGMSSSLENWVGVDSRKTHRVKRES